MSPRSWIQLLNETVPRGGCVDASRPCGQTGDLVAGQDDVAHQLSEPLRRQRHHGSGHVEDRRATADRIADRDDQLLERHPVRSGGVDRQVLSRPRHLEADPSEVVDVNRLNGIAAIARQSEQRRVAQNPGDVVGQHVALAAEDPGRSHDRVRDARVRQRSLDQRLAAVIGQPRTDRRVGDADVDDP